MPVEIDDEAVVAEAPLGGARLELGEVDRPGRELLQDLEECTRLVLGDERDQRRLVAAGRDTRLPTDEELELIRTVLDPAGKRDKEVPS